MTNIARNKKLSVDVEGLLYLEYKFTPNILMPEVLTLYEYFTNKQALIDRRTFLATDCRYSEFNDGQAYIQCSRLYPSQL